MTRLHVGRITRPHGLRGEVIIDLVTDRRERVEPGSQLWADEELVVVAAAHPHQHRWRVQLEGVDDRAGAERLAGRTLTAEPIDDPEALWVHDVIDTVVVERDGTERGRVVAVLENPAHDLLELDSGALVPVVFVVASTDGITTIDPPAGLFE